MMTKKRDNRQSEADRKRRIPRIGGNWRYFALFRLLQLSPSYWLAHEEATSGVSPQTVPAEFDLVRQTYELFGPLWEVPFWEWWRERGDSAFGPNSQASVRVLADLPQGPADIAGQHQLRDVIDAHVSLTPGPTLVLAIDQSSPVKQVLAEIQRLLKSHRPEKGSATGYQLIPDKTRRETVNAAIRTVQARAHFGGPLYVAGNRAVIADYLRTDDRKESGYGDERRTMAIVASRQIKRAHIWSENAARGRFPSSAPPADEKAWPPFDFQRLEERLATYADKSQEALERIPMDQRTNEQRYAGRNWTIRWSDKEAT